MTPRQNSEGVRRVVARAARMLLAVPLAAGVAVAVSTPGIGVLAIAAAAAIAVLTLFRPALGLLLVAGLAPAGGLFAPAPVRVAELFVWTFLAAWVISGWPKPDSNSPPVVRTPALLYAGAIMASWLAFTIGHAAGVPAAALPSFLLQALPPDYLAWGSERPETWNALHAAAGVALMLAAMRMTVGEPRTARAVANILVASAVVLSIATIADLIRQWSIENYGWWFVVRYLEGERYSLHMADLNAAGSVYAMALVAALAFAFDDRRHRTVWVAALALIAPGALLAGSRAAYVAIGAGALLVAALTLRWQPSRRQAIAGAAIGAAMVAGSLLLADRRPEAPGTAGQSASLRAQFTASSLRMIATAPVEGVGIGQYYPRSNEFFTPELRRIYGYENAHNYFLQQFAELGIAGGLLFLAIMLMPLGRAWRYLRGVAPDQAMVALVAGAAAYLLTCLSGHPLLVPEASFLFWITLGVIATVPARADERPPWRFGRGLVILAAAGLVAIAVLHARPYLDVAGEAPPPGGFHEEAVFDDGTPFRWMTRHAVTYQPDGPGFLRLRVRAPDREHAGEQPFILETAIGGLVHDRRELPFGEWVTYDVAVGETAGLPFRRVDLRLNQVAFEGVLLGRQAARRPLGVMVAGIEWQPLQQ